MIDTKLLRQKILDLAIRGKLVPQDPADEPASELLKKIKAEKEALVKAGKIKKDKHESFIIKSDDNRYYETIDGKTTDITDEIPFDLPDSWVWCRIENIGVLNPRNKIEDDTEVSFMPMAQLEAGFGSKYTLSEKNWKEVKSGFTHFAENDVVFAKITPCFQNRKSAVMRGLKNGYGAGTTELHVIRCLSGVIPEYILLFVKNQSFISDAVATIQGVVGQQRIDANFIKKYFLPLPPPAEQQRIVSQIEILLGFVDIIDADAETLEKSITLAKQKILDLAIRGKLVPQDPADEPASELLKKIKAEKEALVKAGKLKKDKHESFIFKSDDNCYHENIDGKTTDITDEIPFDLPESWVWCRLNHVALLADGDWIESKDQAHAGFRLIQTGNIGKCEFLPHDERARYISKETFSKLNCTEIFPGDCLISRLPDPLGRACIVPFSHERMITAVDCTITRPFKTVLFTLYFMYFTGTTIYSEYVEKNATGSTRKRISRANLDKTLLPLPPLAEQKRIVSQVEKLFAVLETMRG